MGRGLGSRVLRDSDLGAAEEDVLGDADEIIDLRELVLSVMGWSRAYGEGEKTLALVDGIGDEARGRDGLFLLQLFLVPL